VLLVYVVFRGGASLGSEAHALIEERRRMLGKLRGRRGDRDDDLRERRAGLVLPRPKDLGGFVVPGLTQIAPGSPIRAWA
jgi:hypothetical protein